MIGTEASPFTLQRKTKEAKRKTRTEKATDGRSKRKSKNEEDHRRAQQKTIKKARMRQTTDGRRGKRKLIKSKKTTAKKRKSKNEMYAGEKGTRKTTDSGVNDLLVDVTSQLTRIKNTKTQKHKSLDNTKSPGQKKEEDMVRMEWYLCRL
ncbi:hypothetical protein M1146_06440 [Patescibacteria group bacterium]|nr:hypothetical protein [Patescibacteria group bacterium]